MIEKLDEILLSENVVKNFYESLKDKKFKIGSCKFCQKLRIAKILIKTILGIFTIALTTFFILWKK